MATHEELKDQLMEQYDLEATVRFIRDNHFQKVCLQFPDHLLSEAPKVVDELERQTKADFYVLGDTAYAPCCVDVVAAQHVAADAVVHYGHSCLSPTRDLPVYYVFEKRSLFHLQKLVGFVKQNPASHLIVLFESYYAHLRCILFSFLKTHINEKTIIPVYLRKSSPTTSDLNTVETDSKTETHCRKYSIGHLEFELDLSIPTEQLQFVWLGSTSSSSFLRASLSLYPFVLDCYDDSTDNWFPANLNATTTLKRRLALISKAQKSHVFGIVVSAIATKGVLDAIERCEVLLNQFEMEWYLLNVGKPTPTKLGNFPEIEVFVLVGCPESAFLDSKSYMKPILTMAELELALIRLYFTDIGSIP
ncbi:Diphthamide biosynthesis protein 2 [Galdieria sulphuraria]|nr:Diphthamide biosynthesis protein 2 [Galdieria sulphuraria]